MDSDNIGLNQLKRPLFIEVFFLSVSTVDREESITGYDQAI
jgi:hypothetical protein